MSVLPDSCATIMVWDPLIRIFHWVLVLSFFVAYITEDDWLDLHLIAGYSVSILLGFRLVWGFIGTRHARFTQFVKPPAQVLAYIKLMLTLKVPHYPGHNPAAAAMIVSLLLCLIMVSFSGMVIIAADNRGPLAGTVWATISAHWMEDVHEFFANFTLTLVFLHIGGVIVSSLLEGENLVRAMITGRKKNRQTVEDK